MPTTCIAPDAGTAVFGMASVETRPAPSTVPVAWLVPSTVATPAPCSVVTRASGIVTSEVTVIGVVMPDPRVAGALVSTTALKAYALASKVLVHE